MKHCKCEKSTSSVNKKCVVCGGDITRKSKKAERDFKKYVEGELKKKCSLCGSKREHFMCNCVSAFACTNKKCDKHTLPPETFGGVSSISASVTAVVKEVLNG